MHNGSTNLPLKRSESGEGPVIPDASIAEMHADTKQVVLDQIRHGVLAEEYGYDRVGFTEHHFQLTGAEFSPNPIITSTAVASHTEEIAIAQWANIVTWHDPIRLAEQTAMLDVISDGRTEVGIGRGYQPRENETLGQYWGGGIQDQEQNRVSYEEKVDILTSAWTEDLLSYYGSYHNVPPKHTKWHHNQEKLYLEDDACEYNLEDVIEWKEGDLYSGASWRAIEQGGSTLNSVPVFPQPRQAPHPQLWQPATSHRSVRFAARNGINLVVFGDPIEQLTRKIDLYHDEAQQAGWVDHRPQYDGEPFDAGWDEDRQRGLATGRWIFNTDIADDETFERWKLGLEHFWDYLVPFGIARGLTDSDDPLAKPTARDIIDSGVAVAGSADDIIDHLAEVKEACGFTDFHVIAFFEVGGLGGAEIDDQLRAFGEDVVPYLREEF